MLVVAPIVILAIGGFIALMVTMVGSVLATRDETTMNYQSQDTLNRIEDDIRLSAQFLTTTGTLISPQGKNDNTDEFTNASNTLILLSLATTKNPADSTRELVYYKNQPYACDSQKVFNQVYFNKVIYFIKNGSLWRRTVMPTYNTNGTADLETVCGAPWQQNSCSPGYPGGTRCQTNDIELMKNISALDVEYYSTPSSTTNLGAGGASIATSIKVTVDGSKNAAGRTIATSQSTRATRLNVSIEPPTVIPLQFTQHPSDMSVLYTDTNVQFSATPSLARATLQWERSTNDGGSWLPIAGETGNTLTFATVNVSMDGYLYRVKATIPEEPPVTSDPAKLNVRVWTPMTLGNGWDAYQPSQTTYASGNYTKTTAGLVMLKGMIAGGPETFDTLIATLPAGYCPSSRLTFYVGSYSATLGSGFGRVDVLAGTGSQTCEVRFMRGTNTWVSLDSIQFLSSGTTCAATVNLTPINGWANWGSPYPVLSLCRDGTGRINARGLVKDGTVTSGTPIGAIPAGYQASEARLMPAVDDTGGAAVFAHIGIYGTGGANPYTVAARGSSTSYLSANVPYIANNGAVTWYTPTILNGSINWGSPHTTLQYGKTSDGVVMVKGLIKNGTVANGTKVFTLPSGYHPTSRMLLPGVSEPNNPARIDVEPDGDVFIQDGGSTNWTSFDSVSFYADGD